VIDLVCYRRWGHNETDEPSYTQPLMYARIKNHPSAASLYGDKLVREGVLTREALDAVWAAKKASMQAEGGEAKTPFAATSRREPHAPAPVDASAMWGRLKTTLRALGTVPDGVEIHPKLVPFVRKRAELLEGKGEVDWSTGEALAFGTLLLEGVPVRLSGQDSGRGTFSQRINRLDQPLDLPCRRMSNPGSRVVQRSGDYFRAGGITLHWFGFGTHLPSGHIVPEQHVQNSPDCEIAGSLRGGGTSSNDPLHSTTTVSGAPRICAVNARTFGLVLQICAPST